MKPPKETLIFNEKAALAKLDRLRKLAEVKFGASAGRRDFYAYLAEVYGYVGAWEANKRINRLRDHVAASMKQDGPRSNSDAYHLVIEATCPKHRRTVSKYAIALANARLLSVKTERLAAFLEQIGGPTVIATRGSIMEVSSRVKKAKEKRARR